MDAGLDPLRAEADLAICGGGPAGTALACMLAGGPFSIAVLEATPREAPARRVARALALSWASRRILEACALWPALEAHATPVREVHVAAPRRFGTLCFQAGDLDVEALGFVVPEDRLLETFWSRLHEAANVAIHRPAEVTQLQADTRLVRLRAHRPGQADHVFNARLIAAADGARSRVRTLAGVSCRRVDYHQAALVMHGRWDRDLEGAACERLTAEGPLAMLPTGGATCKLVYSLTTARAAALQNLPTAARLQHVQECLGRRYGRLLELGEPATWPLVAHTAVGAAPRVVLLGDAASAVHPVAAQGFNRCLRELAALAGLLRELPAHADPGATACLQAFEERVRPDRQRVFGMTHRLARLLAAPSNPGAALLRPLLRSLGMLALDVLPGARRHWLHVASGRYGCQPAWARGA